MFGANADVSTDFAPLIASVSEASAWETLTVHGSPVSVAVPADHDLARQLQRAAAGDRDAVGLEVADRR